MGADCVRHARMFFDRPDYDLASATPGSFAIAPIGGMVEALSRDYANTTAMNLGGCSRISEYRSASAFQIERVINSRV